MAGGLIRNSAPGCWAPRLRLSMLVHTTRSLQTLAAGSAKKTRGVRCLQPQSTFMAHRRFLHSPGRRPTKIVCTIGPSSKDLATLEAMCAAGMDVCRLNSSHRQ
eukprot:2102442-Rhodomonas_salina.4